LPPIMKTIFQGRQFLQWAQGLVQQFLHVVRTAMIDRCLAFANYLERAEAHAITRAARGRHSPLLRAGLPAPTFPDPRLAGRSWDVDFDNAPTAVGHAVPERPRALGGGDR
jgi:hypothetical protein